MLEEKKSLRRDRAFFLQMRLLFVSVHPMGNYSIKTASEALRTHPRRSRRVTAAYSLFILKSVSSLMLYLRILWTNLSPWVREGLPQRPGGPPLPRSRPRGLQRTPPD